MMMIIIIIGASRMLDHKTPLMYVGDFLNRIEGAILEYHPLNFEF